MTRHRRVSPLAAGFRAAGRRLVILAALAAGLLAGTALATAITTPMLASTPDRPPECQSVLPEYLPGWDALVVGPDPGHLRRVAREDLPPSNSPWWSGQGIWASCKEQP